MLHIPASMIELFTIWPDLEYYKPENTMLVTTVTTEISSSKNCIFSMFEAEVSFKSKRLGKVTGIKIIVSLT